MTKTFTSLRSLPDLLQNRSAQHYPVLQDVSFEVGAGEVFGVLGTNGAGKTTLIRILCTMVFPDRGSVTVAGADVAKQPLAVRRRVGYATCADRSFEERIGARANLRFFGVLNDLFGRDLDRRVEEVLAQVGLTEAAGQQVRSFSTGMKQRLAIARALLHDPPILFLDEPTSGLDPLAAHRFRQFLTQLAQDRQRTIFLSTHMPEEIEQLCDRVLFLHRGRSLAAGTLDTIRRSIRANPQYDIDVLGQPHLRGDRLELVVSSCCRSLPGARLLSIQPHRQRTDEYCLQVEFDAQLDRAAVAKFLQGLQRDCGLAVVECRQRQISLADLYAALTGGADLHAA